MPRPVSALQQILECAQPVFGFFLCDAIARLHPPNDAVTPASHDSQVVVRQTTPSFLHSAGQLLPIALNPVPVHRQAPICDAEPFWLVNDPCAAGFLTDPGGQWGADGTNKKTALAERLLS
ncbi:MAG TPA: hypothetical protein VNX86_12105 [Rhizomicrobium sp.]|nr:hypothetical protein [Rhizomicrobium sp.]